MSAIFGLIHLDDSPVRSEELSAMRSAMEEWGPDGGGVWQDGPAGLGSLTLFDTPEAVYEKCPLQSAQGFVLTAEARLDNRFELCRELGIPHSERPLLADGSLVLRAYEKWGANAPAHLIGDWSFAAWHAKEKKLFLARDHFGNTGLYYYQDDRRFAFASSRKALFALSIPRRLNEFYLACVLVSWTAHHGSQTIELDLHRLPPAHTLTLQGSSAQTDLYWRLEDTPELRLQDSRAYLEGMAEVYDRAVRDRLRSTSGIGITLSGGLDSGSVASLAARALRDQNQRLKAFTSVPLHDVRDTVDSDRFGDELPFAQAVASFPGNVDLIEIPANDLTPMQAIGRGLELHDEPGHAAGNLYWIHALLASAQREGLRTLLTGQGGNATISWTGERRSRRMRQLVRAHNWLRIFQLIVYPHLPLPLLRGLRGALRHGGLDWTGTCIHADLVRRVELGSRYIEATGGNSNPEDWYSPLRYRYAIIKPGESFLGSIYAENGAGYSMDIRDPTFDKRVMEFSLSIPDHEFAGPDGFDRWIIRSAMQGIMPDEVRLNRRRGRQAGDLGQRLVNSGTEVEDALGEIEGSQLAQRCLSIERMREVWTSLQQGVNRRNTHLAVTILTRGIMAGMYLVRLEKARA